MNHRGSLHGINGEEHSTITTVQDADPQGSDSLEIGGWSRDEEHEEEGKAQPRGYHRQRPQASVGKDIIMKKGRRRKEANRVNQEKYFPYMDDFITPSYWEGGINNVFIYIYARL